MDEQRSRIIQAEKGCHTSKHTEGKVSISRDEKTRWDGKKQKGKENEALTQCTMGPRRLPETENELDAPIPARRKWV